MKPIRWKSQFLWLMAGLLLVGITLDSCKKKDAKPSGGGNNSGGVARNDEDSLKFYMYYYMESDSSNIPLYYWYSQVPQLNPFSPSYSTAENFLSKITSYPTLSGSSTPVDRYSFLDRTSAVAQQIQGGQGGDLGFDIRWAQSSNGSTPLYVIYAYGNSPAGVAGVQRGWRIVAVNGDTAVSYDAPSYTNVNRVINAVYSTSGTTSFTFQRPDGSDITVSLTPSIYHIDPVLFDTVYNLNGTNVGYFVYNSFISTLDTANHPTQAKSEMDQVLEKFQSSGVKDVIVDLRYNGGGAVVSAEYLDNWFAPLTANQKPMYTYIFNDQLENYYQSNNYNLTTAFDKSQAAGSLTLDHIFFLVGRSTVSASELTINNLKPYMDVKLIGDTTYGKPVGFIPVSIYDYDSTKQLQHLADLYAITFQTKNASNNGDYFQGIPPDKEEYDYVDLNWGDTSDPRLQDAFKYITNGSFARMAGYNLTQGSYSGPKALPELNSKPQQHGFNGMVESRLHSSGTLLHPSFLRKY